MRPWHICSLAKNAATMILQHLLFLCKPRQVSSRDLSVLDRPNYKIYFAKWNILYCFHFWCYRCLIRSRRQLKIISKLQMSTTWCSKVLECFNIRGIFHLSNGLRSSCLNLLVNDLMTFCLLDNSRRLSSSELLQFETICLNVKFCYKLKIGC